MHLSIPLLGGSEGAVTSPMIPSSLLDSSPMPPSLFPQNPSLLPPLPTSPPVLSLRGSPAIETIIGAPQIPDAITASFLAPGQPSFQKESQVSTTDRPAVHNGRAAPNLGVIVGSSVGAAFIALLGAFAVYLWRRRGRARLMPMPVPTAPVGSGTAAAAGDLGIVIMPMASDNNALLGVIGSESNNLSTNNQHRQQGATTSKPSQLVS